MVDYKALIAKQRAELEARPEETVWDVEVSCGGELVKVSLERVSPDEWDELVNTNPPRRGVEGDATIGYNPRGVSAAYPRISLDGERVDAETWAEFFGVLDSVHKNNIGVVIWGSNVNAVLKEMRELGKVRAGKM